MKREETLLKLASFIYREKICLWKDFKVKTLFKNYVLVNVIFPTKKLLLKIKFLS